MKQKDIFLESEGNAWLERNREKLGQSDPVSDVIEQWNLMPMKVLEVGCSNGWRLAKLRDKYGCEVMGIDPSLRACIEAAELKVPVVQTTASMMTFAPEAFDLIIYGFCLYLTDPQDWFRIAAEADSVLKENGRIIIHDFAASRHWHCVTRVYEHNPAIISYHFDFSWLWRVHPQYHCRADMQKPVGDDEMVTIIQKKRIAALQGGS